MGYHECDLLGKEVHTNYTQQQREDAVDGELSQGTRLP